MKKRVLCIFLALLMVAALLPASALTVSASEVEYIDVIEIYGYSYPILGEKAGDHLDLTVPDGAHYSLSDIYWYNDTTSGILRDDEEFTAGNSYSLTCNVRADDGCAFSEDAQVILNGGTMPIDEGYTYRYSDDDGLFVVWNRSVEPLQAIDKIKIYGYSYPILGKKAGDYLDLTVPDGAHYSLSDIYWCNDTFGRLLRDDEEFTAGNSYSLGCDVLADEGYVFTEDAQVILNGGTMPVDKDFTGRDSDSIELFYVWNKPVEPLQAIDKIEIYGYSYPILGEKAGDCLNLTVPDGANYSLSNRYWCNDTIGGFLCDDEEFTAGNSYSLGCDVLADEGYVFTEDAQVILNGGTMPVDKEFTGRDSDSIELFYVWNNSVEPFADGWNNIDGSWYYFEDGTTQTGWVKDGTKWYYLDPSSGVMQTGWQQVGKTWYYLGSDGAMQTGGQWIADNDGNLDFYYFGDNGVMWTGWYEDRDPSGLSDSNWFYFDSDGKAHNGWLEENGRSYYCFDGWTCTGWCETDDGWHKFAADGHLVDLTLTNDQKKNANRVDHIRSFYASLSWETELNLYFRDTNDSPVSGFPYFVNVQIINDNGETLYHWSDEYEASDLGWYNLTIDRSSICPGSTKYGTMYVSVSVPGYIDYYDEIEMTDLPLYPPMIVLTNSLPCEVPGCRITDFHYTVSYNSADLYFTGTRILDSAANYYEYDYCDISWELTDEDGYVIDSGTCMSPSLAVGSSFRDAKDYAFDLNYGQTYYLTFRNAN